MLFAPVLWLSIFGFAGLIAAVAAQSGVAARALGIGPILFLGEISFSIYLCHSPIIQVRNWINDTVVEMNWALSTMGLVPIILVASILTWRYVEKPGRAAGRRFIESKWPVSASRSTTEAAVTTRVSDAPTLPAASDQSFSSEMTRWPREAKKPSSNRWAPMKCNILLSSRGPPG